MDTTASLAPGRRTLPRRLAGVLALVLIASVAASWAPATLIAPANAVDTTRGYEGPCRAEDSNGVTVVIDFQELDGNEGRPAPTIVRCSPVTGNDASVKRTGLQALVDAGIVVSGTQRWGDNYPTAVPFVCRVESRPAADEPMQLTASGTTYIEACGNTPPGNAYWSYWHADGQGGDWSYSDMGVMNRNVTPGGYEGWSFALNRGADDNPKPRVEPVNPATTFTFTIDKSEVEAGQPATLAWKAEGATHVVASGAWNGTRLAQCPPTLCSETIAPATAGIYTYTLTTAGADPTVERSVTLTVTGGDDDTGTPPETGPPHSASSYARQTASWLASELSPAGQMPGPTGGTDWGLSIDTLWALYAAGTGAKASKEITAQVQAHTGEYLGADLFGDKNARLGGSTAKLLVAAVVAGADPEAFGTGRYLSKGKTYDLRAETLALLDSSGAQKGRISNRGTGNDETNVFAQSLAVIGLARSGGVPAQAVDFLISQQCGAGFFRMFYADKLTCDAGKGVGDGDGTAMGVQALITARDNGITGLDDEIARGLDWLLAQQASNGSFGGGVGTSAANSNSTGLIAQTLAAGAEHATGARAARLTGAYEKARDWLLTVHAHESTAKGSQLDTDREYGAIAYNKTSFTKAKTSGISASERDQWRRASAQAILGLAPVSFADLGNTEPVGDPKDQNHPDKPDDDDQGGDKPVPPGTTTTQPVAPATPAEVPTATTPAQKLATYLTSQLVDGDHIEVTADGQTYVDYDATADVWFALRSLGGSRGSSLERQDKTLAQVSAFLLHPKSIAAYAHGAPYDTVTAAYAEPLAKLALIARQSGTGKKNLRTIATLDAALDRLGVELDGHIEDTGTYADHTNTVARYAWLTLAFTAADNTSDEATARLLLGAQCSDGTFPTKLTQAPCESGDPAATALAVQALNSLTSPGASTEPGADAPTYVDPAASNTPPAAWGERDMATRASQIQDAALAALAAVGRTGLPLTEPADNTATADYAVIRQAAGLDASNTATALLGRQRDDGGFTASATAGKKAASDLGTSIALAPVLAGHDWIGQQDAPLITAVYLPLAPAQTTPTAATTSDTGHSTPLLIGVGLLAVLLGLATGLLGPGALRRLRHPRATRTSTSPETPNEASTS